MTRDSILHECSPEVQEKPQLHFCKPDMRSKLTQMDLCQLFESLSFNQYQVLDDHVGAKPPPQVFAFPFCANRNLSQDMEPTLFELNGQSAHIDTFEQSWSQNSVDLDRSVNNDPRYLVFRSCSSSALSAGSARDRVLIRWAARTR